MDLVSLIIAWLVTSVSLFIISKLPTGVEIDSFQKALWSAVVFGLLNAFLRPILGFLAFPITFLTFGLFAIILNAIVFGLAAYLVQGFRLRWGFWSALIGAIALGIINSLIYQLLGAIG
ncbi:MULTISPECIES: phage holin family protein [unclassified Coleofasciculus]|uniref:phage holin family protein n=1 Tax=unclassified Coleofasciculus TaxID=2692782 RepID=UPI00188262D4|nr:MULTISPECIES: phage holin family protein [unclassified Coleofasciculus]MBE9124611.1 phage holin family protein [Coleofasciculus sp. LEGE 07081]MBE9147575.1 phage holin family protein [Coleofasciculus sp. LEGE 07092]